MKKSQILIIFLISVFIFILVYTQHFNNPYPIHIDEWHHITEALQLKNNESNLGRNSLEIGFHIILLWLSYISDLVLIYKFLPALWAVISALVLFFVVYRKTNNNFWIGIFSMVFFASIKSNTNITGIWFFTPLTFSIPFIFLYVYFFTEGVEKQNKRYILISLVLMLFILVVHSVSVLFAIPFLIVYSFFYYKYLIKEYKFFSLFLIIPIIGILFYKTIIKIPIRELIPDLITRLQFKYGWGVTEINNSPLELYSIIGYILAIIGVIFIIYSLYMKKQKKFIPFLLWPLTLLFL